jgi:hypothetical protein
MSAPLVVTNGTQYAIVLYGPTGDAANYVDVQGDNIAAVYAGGTEVWTANAGVDWTIVAGSDIYFIEGATWLWTDVEDLDCDVEYDATGKANTMFCGMVQIQVTYDIVPSSSVSPHQPA